MNSWNMRKGTQSDLTTVGHSWKVSDHIISRAYSKLNLTNPSRGAFDGYMQMKLQQKITDREIRHESDVWNPCAEWSLRVEQPRIQLFEEAALFAGCACNKGTLPISRFFQARRKPQRQ